MQHNNLLKKAILALLLCVAMPCVNAQVAHVGDILCEGNAIVSPANYPSSGATAIGIVFYVDDTGQHGWAIALEDAGSYTWGSAPLPTYTNKRQAIYNIDGYENTRIVLESNSSNPAFNAVDFANGWYLPAIGQLNYLYGNLVEVNAGLAMVGGTVFPSTTSWEYWSSTIYSGSNVWALHSSGELTCPEWYHNFPLSPTSYYSKSVRAARNF